MSDKSDHGSHHSGDSDDTRYQSLSDSSYAASMSTAYKSFSSGYPATELSIDYEENPLKTLEEEESHADSDDYDEATDEFLGAPPPSQKFPGQLAAGEKWLMCPYYPGHFYISTKFASHLLTCRRKYLEENNVKDEDADIVTCKFDYMHHGPRDKVEKHQLNCEGGSLYFIYLDQYIERQRYSNYLAGKEAEKKAEAEAGPSPAPPMKEVDLGADDDKKVVVEGDTTTDTDDNADYQEDKDEEDADGDLNDDDLDFY